ncbi:hypothetical protein [Labrys sp. WJW]|uniref:hypothetical protein n=1 Tax=Labrys sp. WJW TaxID=1737983 RepID=UPI0012E9F792|nr:hypothetical protein [Labrys sp. WJW]
MAYLEKLNDLKGRRSDTKSKTGSAENPLNFALAAGAVGLGIALLESEQAAANSDPKSGVSHDDRRVSDSSAAAEQAKAGVDHSATVDHAIHNEASNGPAAANGGEVNALTASSPPSENSPDGLPRGTESAHSSAEAAHGSAGSSAAGALIGTALADDALSATLSHSSSGEGGLAVVTHSISAVTGPLAEALAPVEQVLEPVTDVVHNLLGNNGVLPVSLDIGETVKEVLGPDGIIGSLIGDDGNIIKGLVDPGNGLDSIVTKVTSLVGGDDGNILHALADTGKEGLDGVVGKDGLVGSLLGSGGVLSGLTGGQDETPSQSTDNGGHHDSNNLDGLADAGKESLDGVVGKDGLVGGLLGGGGVLSGLTGGHDETSSQSVDNSGHNSTSPAVTAAHESTPAPATEAASATETAAATTHAAAAETPTDMFAATHAALQITEGVAHALTPILTFVGQPFIDDDGHTDTDHSHHASTHHAA